MKSYASTCLIAGNVIVYLIEPFEDTFYLCIIQSYACIRNCYLNVFF